MLNWRDSKHPKSGGSETLFHELGSRWARQGNEVTLFCGGYKGGRSEEEVSGVKVIRAGGRYTVYLHALKFLSTESTSRGFDVIFESINTVPFYSPLVSKIPVVAEVYSAEAIGSLLRRASYSEFPLVVPTFLAASSMPRIYSNCHVVTISASAKKNLVEAGLSERLVHVAYPGISKSYRDLVAGSPSHDRPNKTIAYLGRLMRYKGVQDILNALAKTEEQLPGVKLLVMGRGDFEGELRSMASRLGVGDRVQFCGYVSEKEKATLLKEASLYVCTSLDEGGWTITAVEAMAAGAPVLVTDSQVDVLDGGATGRLLRSNAPELMAEQIVRMLRDRPGWESYSKEASRFSAGFDWDQTATTTLEILEKAAS